MQQWRNTENSTRPQRSPTTSPACGSMTACDRLRVHANNWWFPMGASTSCGYVVGPVRMADCPLTACLLRSLDDQPLQADLVEVTAHEHADATFCRKAAVLDVGHFDAIDDEAQAAALIGQEQLVWLEARVHGARVGPRQD